MFLKLFAPALFGAGTVGPRTRAKFERRVERQVVEAERADVHAVDRVVGRAVSAAFDGDVLAAAAAGGAELRAAVERLRRHAGGERGKGEQVAPGDRQVLDLLLRNRL